MSGGYWASDAYAQTASVRRVGLAIELEDGSVVTYYSQDCAGVQVTMETVSAPPLVGFTGYEWRSFRPTTNITIEGLQEGAIHRTGTPFPDRVQLPGAPQIEGKQ